MMYAGISATLARRKGRLQGLKQHPVFGGGLAIESLTENPHPEQTTVPGTFTLVANKAS